MKYLTAVFGLILFCNPVYADCVNPAPNELIFTNGTYRIVGAVENIAPGEGDIDPLGIAVGQQFSLLLRPCNADVEVKNVDARMPAHGHGMNYRTWISQPDANLTKADGLLFHMPGHWEVVVDVSHNNEDIRLISNIMLKP